MISGFVSESVGYNQIGLVHIKISHVFINTWIVSPVNRYHFPCFTRRVVEFVIPNFMQNTKKILLKFEYLVINCYVYTQFYLALYMCVFILNGFPYGYF